MTRKQQIKKHKSTLTTAAIVALAVLATAAAFRSTRSVEARNNESTTMTPAPFAPQVYELPLRGDDLNVGERFMTFIHKEGIQAEGKDISALRHVSDDNWSSLKTDGADKTVLTNYVDYGKPFYAMAPGTVIACWRNAPENTPGSLRADIDK